MSERCLIGFNAGPPLSGGGYNANIQLVQSKTHAVILTEMVHDARIVPWMTQAHSMIIFDYGPVTLVDTTREIH